MPGGVMAATLGSDGSGGDLLTLPAAKHNHVPIPGVEFSSNGHNKNTVGMDGRQVYRFATNIIPASVQEVLRKANLTLDDVALIVLTRRIHASLRRQPRS
ncbi:MAG: hypothetical protein R3C44_12350 [Chloroflexota bacterium]